MSLIIKARAEGWVTINGVHVYISNLGKIKKGPAKFIGSTIDDLKGQKMSADKKAELQKKYGKKTSEKPSERKSKDDSKESKTKDKSPNDTAKMQEKEHLAKLYANGVYNDTYLRSVAMDNYGMSSKDVEDIVKMAGGRNTTFSDRMEANRKIQQNTSGSFKSGGESYTYSMDGSYMSVKNSKGIEVASEKVGTSNLGVNASQTAKSILKATQANGGNALDVRSSSKATTPKYPSGIETASQKRAYTRAINSGKSTAEATKSALNAGKGSTNSPASANTGNPTFDSAYDRCIADDIMGSVHRDTNYDRRTIEFYRALEAETMPWQVRNKKK